MNFKYRQPIKMRYQGVRCWNAPLKGRTIKGQTINIIIIDSNESKEKIYGSNKDEIIQNLAILKLVCYLSSTIIFHEYQSLEDDNVYRKIIKSMAQKCYSILPSECSPYFPQINWTIRDSFTWQDIERQNNFKTLARSPKDTQGQKSLSSIKNMNLEFIKQVNSLQAKVMNNLKPSVINGQRITGRMLCSILLSFLRDMNINSDFNVQNALHSMNCPINIKKIQKISKDFNMNFLIYFPKDERQIKIIPQSAKYKYNKVNCLNQNNHNGDIGLKYLSKKMNKPIETLKLQKNKVTWPIFLLFIQQNFQNHIKRLKINEYPNYSSYRKQIYKMRDFFLKIEPENSNSIYFYERVFQKLQCIGIIYFLYNSINLKIAHDIIDRIYHQIQKQLQLSKRRYQKLCKPIIQSQQTGNKDYLRYFQYGRQDQHQQLQAQLHHNKNIGEQSVKYLQDEYVQYHCIIKQFDNLSKLSKKNKRQSLLTMFCQEHPKQVKYHLYRQIQLIEMKQQIISKYQGLFEKWKKFTEKIIRKRKYFEEILK